MTDPRDIERINPENPNVDTNVNSLPETEDATGGTSVLGVVNKTPGETPKEAPADKQTFPGKGDGENKRAAKGTANGPRAA